jgi:hypothetical protein
MQQQQQQQQPIVIAQLSCHDIYCAPGVLRRQSSFVSVMMFLPLSPSAASLFLLPQNPEAQSSQRRGKFLMLPGPLPPSQSAQTMPPHPRLLHHPPRHPRHQLLMAWEEGT